MTTPAPRATLPAVPATLATARRARGRLAQFRRSLLKLLTGDDCGLQLVLEDARTVDAHLAAFGVEGTRIDVVGVASIGRQCRALQTTAARGDTCGRCTAQPHACPPWRRHSGCAHAGVLQAHTASDMLHRLHEIDRRLYLAMHGLPASQPAA